GRLENSGRITSASGATITTKGSIANSGTLYTEGNAALQSSEQIENSGVIAAKGDTTLAAADQIGNSAGAVIGAGVNTDGTIGTVGTLEITAGESIVSQGQTLSGGDQVLEAKAIDLTGGRTTASNLNLTASLGDINLTGATIGATGLLTAAASRTLRTDQAKIAAVQINPTAHDLSNVQGEIVQTGAGDLTITLPGNLDNTLGRIASNSNNLTLNAVTITNSDSRLEHAGPGILHIDAQTLQGDRGVINSNGLLQLAAPAVSLNAASTRAAQLSIESATLANRGGEIIQTGDGPTSVKATTLLDNSSGVISGNGETVLTVGTLVNQGGLLQAAGASLPGLRLAASGHMDNSLAGTIAAAGSAILSGASLDNTTGSITAGTTLEVNVANGLTNRQGKMAGNREVAIQAARIDNTQGTMGSVGSQATVTATAGEVNNTLGVIGAGAALTLNSLGLVNRDGRINEAGIAINGNDQALDNTRGRITSTGPADIRSGALDNNSGLIQTSAGSLNIDTHGQSLVNTNSGSQGGIVSRENLQLTTGILDNMAGYIGSSGQLGLKSGDIGNTSGGKLVSAGQMELTGSLLDNRGGEMISLGSVGMHLSGELNNSGSLIRSAGALDITAAGITNQGTQGLNQGMEGAAVTLAGALIDNRQGAIRAGDVVTLTASDKIDNSLGLISSANRLTMQDVNPANKTLAINNGAGTVIAGSALAIDSKSLSGDGKLLSRGDMTIRLTDDLVNSGEIAANGTAGISMAGGFSNSATVQAGQEINLTAAAIDNQAAATISAGKLLLQAGAGLTNRGLIDGGETLLAAATLNNLGTGRIYGDHLAIAATTLNNLAESGAAPVLAARDRLDIGAGTINNREHALIFSAGDMAVGGALDTDRRATGQGTTLNNNSATIEALGDLSLSVRNINNTNEHFSTRIETVSVEPVVEYQGGGSPNRYLEGTPDVYTYKDEALCLHTPDGYYGENWSHYNYDRTTSETKVATSDPAQILAGGNMAITADILLNDKSRIIAGGALTGDLGTLTNSEVAGERVITDLGTQTSVWRKHRKGRDGTGSSTTDYAPAPIIQAITLTPTVYQQNTTPTGSGARIAAHSGSSVAQPPSGATAPSVAIPEAFAVTPIT
ncbi:MAG: S-layer family protein, partial [Rhodocyclaceae bacterium]|nr:S-layer family protein [Rhodocyclaceae bacterium]